MGTKIFVLTFLITIACGKDDKGTQPTAAEPQHSKSPENEKKKEETNDNNNDTNNNQSTNSALESITPNSGSIAGGYTAKITGTKLTNTMKVFFGEAADYECQSYDYSKIPTEISCKVARGPYLGNVKVKLYDPSGTGGNLYFDSKFSFTDSIYGNHRMGDLSGENTNSQFLADAEAIDSTGKVVTYENLALAFTNETEILWHVDMASSNTACGGGLVPGEYGFARLSSFENGKINLDRDIRGSNTTAFNAAAISNNNRTAGSGTFCLIKMYSVGNVKNLTIGTNQISNDARIFAIRVDGTFTVSSNSTISSISGYPSGLSSLTASTAKAGSSVNGEGIWTGGCPANGSGGGCGANGGGNAGAGGGGNGGAFGVVQTCANSKTCVFPGAGGGGSNLTNSPSAQGKGGGAVIVIARNIAVTSGKLTLSANAIAYGTDPSGGGAGGQIIFYAKNITGDIDLSSTGANANAGEDRGGGGGGFISGGFCSKASGTITTYVTGGTKTGTGLNGSTGQNLFDTANALASSSEYCL